MGRSADDDLIPRPNSLIRHARQVAPRPATSRQLARQMWPEQRQLGRPKPVRCRVGLVPMGIQQRHGAHRVKARQLIVGELKTPRSRRSLALTPEILAKLRQHHTRQAEHKMAAGPAWRDHGLIFASETGAPLDPENFSRTFAKLCNRAGLGHWHPHELRHSGASLMLAQGTPLHVVSEILGHASIMITKDVYGHLYPGEMDRYADRLNEAAGMTDAAKTRPDGTDGEVGSEGSTC